MNFLRGLVEFSSIRFRAGWLVCIFPIVGLTRAKGFDLIGRVEWSGVE